MKAAVSAQKALQGSETEKREEEESNDGWELVAIQIFESLDMLFQISTGQQAQARGYGRITKNFSIHILYLMLAISCQRNEVYMKLWAYVIPSEQKLNDPSTPSKVYQDMHQWWVRGSKCKKLKSSMFQ